MEGSPTAPRSQKGSLAIARDAPETTTPAVYRHGGVLTIQHLHGGIATWRGPPPTPQLQPAIRCAINDAPTAGSCQTPHLGRHFEGGLILAISEHRQSQSPNEGGSAFPRSVFVSPMLVCIAPRPGGRLGSHGSRPTRRRLDPILDARYSFLVAFVACKPSSLDHQPGLIRGIMLQLTSRLDHWHDVWPLNYPSDARVHSEGT